MTRAEAGWILEVNEAMNRAMEALTGRVVKRYRIYERPLHLGGEAARKSAATAAQATAALLTPGSPRQ